MWPFKKKRWGGKIRIVKVSSGTAASYQIQQRRTTLRGYSYWDTTDIRYDEADAIEDAQGLWDQMHTRTEVIAE